MSLTTLTQHPKAFGTAALVAAFTVGVLVTLGFKDAYPDLERRYQRKTRGRRSLRRQSSFFWTAPPLALEDRDSGPGSDEEDEGEGDAEAEAEARIRSFLPDGGAAPPPPLARDGMAGCIGNTPLIELRSLSRLTGRTILAKAEFLNGAGNSPKDRVALAIITQAEADGLLDAEKRRGDTIYEGSVGSTGISLAALARARGYRAHICMPDDQGPEKSDLLRHLGAVVERVPVAPITSPDHYVNLARRRAEDHTRTHADSDGSRGFFADQFDNAANWRAHATTTGPEILAQTYTTTATTSTITSTSTSTSDDDEPYHYPLDAFVAGAGTGGTLTGVAHFLKLQANLPNIRIILADPQGSGLYHKIKHGVMYSPTEREGTRRRTQVDSLVEGIGVNRVTANLEAGLDLVDDAVTVMDDQACRMARWLVEREGLFVGSSSAVNCVAAVGVALGLPSGGRVVTVLCDSGTRHMARFWGRVKDMGLESDGEGDDDGDDDDDEGERFLAELGLVREDA